MQSLNCADDIDVENSLKIIYLQFLEAPRTANAGIHIDQF